MSNIYFPNNPSNRTSFIKIRYKNKYILWKKKYTEIKIKLIATRFSYTHMTQAADCMKKPASSHKRNARPPCSKLQEAGRLCLSSLI